MSNLSAIEWTDATWNPVTGCDRVSAGCDHCYALTLSARLKAMGNPRYQNDGTRATSGPGFGVTLHPDKLTDPLRWMKPRRIFVNSMSDLFHAEIPIDFIFRVFAVMAMAPQHTFQILTKRPQRMYRVVDDPATRDFVEDAAEELAGDLGWCHANLPEPLPWPLPNVWLGTSVENQEAAYRIDFLVRTSAAVRFLSCEPLLGPLDLSAWLWEEAGPEWAGKNPSPDLGWVIVGGESGPGFRAPDPVWASDICTQCVDAQVPFFFKQWGGIRPKARGRMLLGREWDEMPAVASQPLNQATGRERAGRA